MREAERTGQPWTKLPLAKLREFSPEFGEDFHAALSVEASLAAHAVTGGTAPDTVRAAIRAWREKFAAIGAAR